MPANSLQGFRIVLSVWWWLQQLTQHPAVVSKVCPQGHCLVNRFCPFKIWKRIFLGRIILIFSGTRTFSFFGTRTSPPLRMKSICPARSLEQLSRFFGTRTFVDVAQKRIKSTCVSCRFLFLEQELWSFFGTATLVILWQNVFASLANIFRINWFVMDLCCVRGCAKGLRICFVVGVSFSCVCLWLHG